MSCKQEILAAPNKVVFYSKTTSYLHDSSNWLLRLSVLVRSHANNFICWQRCQDLWSDFTFFQINCLYYYLFYNKFEIINVFVSNCMDTFTTFRCLHNNIALITILTVLLRILRLLFLIISLHLYHEGDFFLTLLWLHHISFLTLHFYLDLLIQVWESFVLYFYRKLNILLRRKTRFTNQYTTLAQWKI